MKRCSSCKNFLPETAFKKIKATLSKTCNQCLDYQNYKNCEIRKSKKNSQDNVYIFNNDDIELAEIHINQLSQFVEEFVANEKNKEFELNILFDINVEMNSITQVAKKLREIIEDSDGYKWNFWKANYSTCLPDQKGIIYYHCSQSAVLNKFKNSNRKQITRFECNGQLIIRINMINSKAYIKVKHLLYHECPAIFTGVSKEIIAEINQNYHLDSLQLHSYFFTHFDLQDITPKQIYYWWSVLIQSKYQKHKDPICSAIILLQEQFQDYHFELYRIIGEYQETGFALGYLILDIIRINGELKLSKSEILTQFLLKFQILGLSPDFIFIDKDFTLINAIKNVWPNKGIQLYLWHLKKVILIKIKSNKQQAIDSSTYRLIYNTFYCNRQYPFWIQISEESNILNIVENEVQISEESNILNILESDNENNLVIEEIERKIEKHEQFIQYVQEEYEAGNIQHVKALLNGSKRIYTMIDDIKKAQSK
ncbi:21601_t:CDS:2 [Cetraspora pellucida]|uniref:21601_t:CDS:1 n=1 Tax=Cetraspora pellucida TaxID=1433469 RepID=A0A9N9F186_9GLOM|nr:21601_t:CDS:2 [Cetraspora pellucida]